MHLGEIWEFKFNTKDIQSHYGLLHVDENNKKTIYIGGYATVEDIIKNGKFIKKLVGYRFKDNYVGSYTLDDLVQLKEDNKDE